MSDYEGQLRYQYLDHLGQWKEIDCDRMTFEPSGHVAFWRFLNTGRWFLIHATDREYCIRINQLETPFMRLDRPVT